MMLAGEGDRPLSVTMPQLELTLIDRAETR